MMRIFIDKARFYAYHGVMEQERRVGAEYTVSVSVYYDFGKAAETDNLDDTISYAIIFNKVKEEMAIPSRLLENVAYRIAQSIKTEFSQVERVEVEVVKCNPPMGASCNGAGVFYEG